MLVDPKFIDSHLIADIIAESNNRFKGYYRLRQGVYEIGHFSFDMLINPEIKEQYPTFPEELHKNRHPHMIDSYGVCDSVEQLLDTYDFDSDPRELIVSVTKVVRKDQEPEGGWRWHKWGGYIGDFEPQCEYLYDEEGIEHVYCYHIYELT